MPAPRRIPIFDGHNDVLLRLHRRAEGDAATAFLKGEDKGQLDLAKAKKGGFAGGLFAIFVPSPDRRREAGTAGATSASAATAGAAGSAAAATASAASATTPNFAADPTPPEVDLGEAQRTVFAMAALLYRIERQSRGRLRVCRDAKDIARCLKDGALAAVLHIEGAEAIDANFELLDVLHEAGLRSIGPVWSRPNAFGYGVPFRCPSSPDTGPGLTELGKALIAACNRLRILIDLSHLNERGFWDVAELSVAPLVATHSNAHAISPHSRNLTDRQLAAIKKSKGMVGVNFSTSFLRPDGRRDKDTPLDVIVQHVEHLLEHVGEDGVGFGSDFDGAQMPAELGDAAGLQKLVATMRERGFSQALIEKLCYRNWLRVLGRTWGEI